MQYLLELTTSSHDGATPVGDKVRHNIVLFGESGAGKSSIVNMLVGRDVASTGSGTRGVTLDSKGYDFSIGGVAYRIHDTAGLNESEGGRVPSKEAVMKLYKLLIGLETQGVSLLVFCIRGPRIRENTKFNWTLFYEIICQMRVPIVIIVTGLEQEQDMDEWWDKEDNWDTFRNEDMQPVGHACITGTKGKRRANGKYALQEDYDESVVKVKKLIQKHRKGEPWKQQKIEWFKHIYKTTYHTRCFRKPEKRSVLIKTVSEPVERLVEVGLSEEEAKKWAELLEKVQKGLDQDNQD